MDKKCTLCNETKNVSNFHRYKRSKDGYRTRCKDCRKKKYELNSEYERNRVREYYLKNKEKVKEYQKTYRQNNRDKVNARGRLYKRIRRRSDEVYLVKENVSCLIRNCLKNYGFKKNTKTYSILGIDVGEFKDYLNNNPYGFKYNDEDIDLDHIVPISSATTQEEAIKLNHYTNFQLLPKEYNRNVKMDNSFDVEHFNDWYGARAVEKVTKIRKNK